MSNNNSWTRFLGQLEKDLTVWISWLVYFTIYRAVLIFSFADRKITEFNPSDIFAAAHVGFLFDLVPSTIFIVLPLLVSFSCLFYDNVVLVGRVRNSVLWITVSLTFFLSLVNFFFFKEYKDQFNYWIFGVIYDDRTAILKTIWQDSPVIWVLIGFVLGTLGLVRLFNLLIKIRIVRLNRLCGNFKLTFRIVFLLILVTLLIGGLRGGFRSRPIQMKDSEKTQDTFLNKTIPNFYKSLEVTISVQIRNSNADKLPRYVPGKSIHTACEIFFGYDCTNIDKCLEKKVVRTSGAVLPKKPRHIFLLILESYDLWSFFQPYDKLGLTAYGQELAQNGLFFVNFTSAGLGTMPTVSSIMSGVPHTGLQFAYQKRMHTPMPTSIAEIFKRLGYKTKFYYGGYLSWQNVGKFAEAQGFDETIGANTIKPDFPFGDWGIPDKDLFEFVYNSAMEDQQPTFHVILSLSYHRPFKIDVYSEGFVPPKLDSETQHLNDSSDAMMALGHLWYSDKVMGEFIKKFEAVEPNSLFAITGDHWSRKGLPKTHNNIYQRSAVPLILYGIGGGYFSHGKRYVPGDHLDIAPTLVELIAPEGFVYHSYGDSLLNTNKSFASRGSNGSEEVVLTPGVLFLADNPDKVYILETEEGTPPPDIDKDKLKGLADQHLARKAIAWWHVMRGAEIQPEEQ